MHLLGPAGVFLSLVPEPDVWTHHRMWGVCTVSLKLEWLLTSAPENQFSLACKSQISVPPHHLSWKFNTPVHTLFLSPPSGHPASSIWGRPSPRYAGAQSSVGLLRLVLKLLKEKWRHILAIKLMGFATNKLDVGEKREQFSKIPNLVAWTVG